MKPQDRFSLCCVVGLIFCVGGLIVDTWGKPGYQSQASPHLKALP
jgi:hypothetical protein